MMIKDSTVYLEEVGWDAGYGQQKIVCQKGVFTREGARSQEFYTKLSYPSYYCLYNHPKVIESIIKREGIALEKLIVSYKNTDYAIGEFAVVQSPGGTKQIFDKDKFRSEGEIAKFLAGMAYLFPDYDEIQIANLIVGLSIESYAEYKQELQELYQEREFAFTVLHTGRMKPMRVAVRNVSCKIQGNGAFLDKFFDMNEFGEVFPSKDRTRMTHIRFGICDPGAKTVDNYLSEGAEPISGTECVFNYGLNNIFKEVSAQLNHFPEKRLESTYLNYINPKVAATDKRPHLYWAKQTYPMSEVAKLCDQAFANFGREIGQRLKQHWQEHLDLVELIILCGGGANSPAFVTAFQSQFEIPVEVTDEPEFSNAFGYLKAAKFERYVAERLNKRKTS